MSPGIPFVALVPWFSSVVLGSSVLPKSLLDLHIVRLHPRLQTYGRECVLLMFVIYFAMHPKYK